MNHIASIPHRRAPAWRCARLLLGVLVLLLPGGLARAFCGFYVAGADTRLYNKASQVVLVRDGERTVMTMGNDFRGNVRDFAMVVPIPTTLAREQIHVAERALLDRVDAYTAPRLVEYFDANPCAPQVRYETAFPAAAARDGIAERQRSDAKALGVRIEARYTVGEYDILILSARESGGLVTWLTRNGYRLPAGAAPIVGSYLRQGMRFFVAKVNLGAQARAGYQRLRPLQIAYEHRRFMLPIRLGTLNADGMQELFVYGLSRGGRIEATNYRTVALPTDVNLPEFVQPSFADFYRAMVRRQGQVHGNDVLFLEYAWDLGWCDPCAADPLTAQELRELGVFWLGGRTPSAAAGAADTFVTRLHVRYDAAHFPEDLQFEVTGNRQNFQGRYVLQRAWSGEAACPEARRYFGEELPARREREVRALAQLTGWNLGELRQRLPAVPEYRGPAGREPATSRRAPGAPRATDETPWWRRIWRDG